jgi:hypothetical protein
MKHFRVINTSVVWIVIIILASLASGCGLLLGTVKPVEEKSEDYRVLDLSKADSDWIKLPPAPLKDSATSESSDVTFQSKKTASIISLNTACRQSLENQKQDLHSFTQELLLGIGDITKHTEREMTVQGTAALETTIQGQLNAQQTMLRVIVLHEGACIYDLMYISRPEFFDTYEAEFARFVGSLRIKK